MVLSTGDICLRALTLLPDVLGILLPTKLFMIRSREGEKDVVLHFISIFRLHPLVMLAFMAVSRAGLAHVRTKMRKLAAWPLNSTCPGPGLLECVADHGCCALRWQIRSPDFSDTVLGFPGRSR